MGVAGKTGLKRRFNTYRLLYRKATHLFLS